MDEADFDIEHMEFLGKNKKMEFYFLIDVSGSMNSPDKLPLLIKSFRLLLQKLNPDDTVSIVTYAGHAGTALEPTKVTESGKILNALATLVGDGKIRTTLTETLSPINAANLKTVHALIESGTARGKIVLEGF